LPGTELTNRPKGSEGSAMADKLRHASIGVHNGLRIVRHVDLHVHDSEITGWLGRLPAR
jgi:hypothetical protein